jgi:putative membrane protein
MSDGNKSSGDAEGYGDLRVFFAGQRTMLAWVRTGVALMGFGFVVAKFGMFMREMAAVREVETTQRGVMSLWAGTALLVIGVAVNLVAAARYARFAREFKANTPPRATGIGPELWLAGVLSALGIAMAVYLALVQ